MTPPRRTDEEMRALIAATKSRLAQTNAALAQLDAYRTEPADWQKAPAHVGEEQLVEVSEQLMAERDAAWRKGVYDAMCATQAHAMETPNEDWRPTSRDKLAKALVDLKARGPR